MSYQKTADIIIKISKKTQDDLIEWETTERAGKYQVSFSNYSIRIFKSISNETPGDDDYIIQVINGYGETVEEVSDVDIKSLLPDAYKIMKNTYELARRKAMGVDEALDSILDELDE